MTTKWQQNDNKMTEKWQINDNADPKWQKMTNLNDKNLHQNDKINIFDFPVFVGPKFSQGYRPWCFIKTESDQTFSSPGARNASFGDRVPSFWWPTSWCLLPDWKTMEGKPLVAADMGRYGGFLSHGGTHKSSTLIIGFSIINQPLWGSPQLYKPQYFEIFWNRRLFLTDPALLWRTFFWGEPICALAGLGESFWSDTPVEPREVIISSCRGYCQLNKFWEYVQKPFEM